MLGQEQIPGMPFELVPEREATQAEWNKFEKLVSDIDRLDNAVYASRLRFLNWSIIKDFGSEEAIYYPLSFTESDFARLQKVSVETQKLKSALRAVQDRQLGVRFSNGDIDFVRPGIGPEQDGIFIAIAVGVVVVAGAIALSAYLWGENKEVNEKLKVVTKAAEKGLCQDPNSPKCKKWKIAKRVNGFDRNKSAAEQVDSWLSKAGKAVTGGLHWGILLAIPLAIFMLMPRRK